jgi:hypothetical protein
MDLMTPDPAPPLELAYVLHPLPVSRIAFRRWRWELWHGPRLLAAGWRRNVLHAQHALRAHAIRYGHRRLGVHALRAELTQPIETVWGGRRIAVDSGDLRVVLTPREVLDRPHALSAAS